MAHALKLLSSGPADWPNRALAVLSSCGLCTSRLAFFAVPQRRSATLHDQGGPVPQQTKPNLLGSSASETQIDSSFVFSLLAASHRLQATPLLLQELAAEQHFF